MRHKVAGWKLGRNPAHRRSLLRNLVTSLIIEERIETTVPKAKAMRPLVEKMITLGKRGDLAARRQALAYLMTSAAVDKLFDTVGPRFGDRNGGYLRIVRTGWRKGAGRKAPEACRSAFQTCRGKQASYGRSRSSRRRGASHARCGRRRQDQVAGNSEPHSGARMQPTAQAVGFVCMAVKPQRGERAFLP